MGFLDDAVNSAKDQGSQLVEAGLKRLGISGSDLEGSTLFGDSSKLLVDTYKLSQDSLMFAFQALDTKDSFKKYDYEFAIYDIVKNQKIIAFTLPLPPQSINISVPAAINTTVTMKGIVEEHNGAPLRQISISGSTGVYPTAVSAPGEQKGGNKKGPLDYLFQNTIAAAQSTLSSAKQTLTAAGNIASAFMGESLPLNSPVIDPQETWTQGGQTGYIIAHNLMRFMDLYLEFKKNGNKNLTLMFLMHKDKMYYNCSLSNLSIRKGAGTLEYLYSISLVAWQRWPELPKAAGQRTEPGTFLAGHNEKSINPFAQINRTLDLGIATINKSLSVLQGFQSDLNTAVLQPLKKVRILAKTVANVPKTITDYSDVIIRSAEAQIKDTFANLSHDQSQSRTAEQIRQKIKSINAHVYGGQPQRDGRAQTSPFDVSANARDNSNFGPDGTKNQLALVGGDSSVDPFSDMFENPAQYDEILSVATINTLQLNSATVDLISQEETAASLLAPEDVQIIKYSLDSFTALLSQRLGGNSRVYDQIYGLSAPTYTKALTTEDIETLGVMNDMSLALDQMIVLMRSQKNTTDEDYSRWYGTYARTQGIDFVESNSKFYVPFPLGASLESLSNTYLGDVNRWIEIAAINGLKEPYIDEIGFYVPFRSSGSGNSFLVTTPDGLYIGQPVLIESITQRPEPRRIDSIKIISSIQTLITVNGDSDLSKFTVADQAKLHAYMPNTVNSTMMIAIPSQNVSQIPSNMNINPSEKDLQNITYMALSDFALNFDVSQGTADIQFVGSDVAVSRSYANLTQAAFIKLYTHQGDLLDDPLFGNPVQVGSSVATFNPSTALNELAILFAQDNRFTGLKAGRVLTKGGSVNIELLLGIASTNTFMPIKTTVPTR